MHYRIPKKLLIFGALCLSLPLFLLVTSPDHLPLPLLIVPFFLIFMIFFYGLKEVGGAKTQNMSRRQRNIRAGLIAAVPVLLAVLQSIHQLTAKDIIITVGLVLVAYYYLTRVDFL